MVSLTDLAANPDLLIAFQRQQAARRRLEQAQPSEPRTPAATWMSALAQGLMNFQAAQADQRLEAVARQERERGDAEVAQAFEAVRALNSPPGAAPAAAPVTVPTPAARPASMPVAAPAMPGRVGGPAAAAPNMDPGSPDYDPIAASRARLRALPGAPQEAPGGYRAPAGEGNVYAGLAPPTGVLGNVSGPPAQQPPQQAAPGQPDQRLFATAQSFALSRNPQVRALAPLLMQQYERQQADQRAAAQAAQAQRLFELQLAASERATAAANRETFGAPVTVMQNGREVLVQVGNRGTIRPVTGYEPMGATGMTPAQAQGAMLRLAEGYGAGTLTPQQQREFETAVTIARQPRTSFDQPSGQMVTIQGELPPFVLGALARRAPPPAAASASPAAVAPAASPAAPPASTSAAPAAAPAGSPVTAGNVTVAPVTAARPTPQAVEAARQSDVGVGRVMDAINNLRTALEPFRGATGLAALNPRSVEGQRLASAYEILKMAMRDESLLNTGVLQPAENVMIEQMLRSPTSLTGLLASMDAYNAMLDQFAGFVTRGSERVRAAAGQPALDWTQPRPGVTPDPRDIQLPDGQRIGPPGRPAPPPPRGFEVVR
jgi:hypothetical protein